MKAHVAVQVFLMSSFMYSTRHSLYFNCFTCILQPYSSDVDVSVTFLHSCSKQQDSLGHMVLSAVLEIITLFDKSNMFL